MTTVLYCRNHGRDPSRRRPGALRGAALSSLCLSMPVELQLKGIPAGEGCLGRGSTPERSRSIEVGRMRALQGSLARPPPFWLSLPTAVSKQVGGRLEDARCLTPNAGREKQRLEGVAENGDEWTRETAGRPVGGFQRCVCNLRLG